MGKRKKAASKPMGPKKREALATTFQCLFCNHENSVTVRMEKKLGTGSLSCKICGQDFQTSINYLSAPVDVYSDWIDACDAVAKSEAADTVGQAPRVSYREKDISTRAPPPIASRQLNKKASEMDDFIEDDEPDGEADFDDNEGDEDD